MLELSEKDFKAVTVKMLQEVRVNCFNFLLFTWLMQEVFLF